MAERVIYSDMFVTIANDENGVQYLHFHPAKNLGERKTMAKFLHYFAVEVPYMSKQALIDLITMAHEFCNETLNIAEQKFLKRLYVYDCNTLISIVWNKILAGEGLSLKQ